jgi:hypothetical protein
MAATAQEPVRLLVVASEALSADDLEREIAKHASGREAEALIVFPAFTDSPLKNAFGDVDEGIEAAEKKRRRELEEAERAGIKVRTARGDADPLVALEDALATYPADEVLIVTRSGEQAARLEQDLFERAKAVGPHPPMTHVELNGGGAVETETAGASDSSQLLEGEHDPESGNLPPYTTRDLAGIFVAIAGTIALFVIAVNCPGNIGEGFTTDAACTAELIIAGAAALINVAHVIGLLLFTATRYRGFVERFFSLMSLIGTPLALVAVLVISATH